ncbi:MAG TPA: threonine synthase [Methylocella sp.]|nr:threonine synthase [Methylocella sp.]
MNYISTRGEAPPVSFLKTLLAGLAPDGGLYLPQAYPHIQHETIAAFAGRPYADVAQSIISPFVTDEIAPSILSEMIASAYKDFRHSAIAPLVQLDANLFVLELFHGPTLAFKDLAMQLLARFMDHILKSRGERATIIGATSGDTGAAAIEAFAALSQVDVFILYPHGRISDVQRRQMTTVDAPNIHAIALEGSFDDAQSCVKALFNHRSLREEFNFCGVNSINFARILFQAVYYFTGATALGAPYRKVSFVVPTGNFGDIFAGFLAKRMGLPIDRLVIATNANDILTRTLESGEYRVTEVTPTQSPSMDIQLSSNFERLLFEAHDRNASTLRQLMAELSQSRSFSIAPEPLSAIRSEFDARRASEAETTQEIAHNFAATGYLADPHTAVGLSAARKIMPEIRTGPIVVLGTAHPGKFPEAILRATGVEPSLPEPLSDLAARPERFTVLRNDLREIEHFIRTRSIHAAKRVAS